jgi:hypothetical protein
MLLSLYERSHVLVNQIMERMGEVQRQTAAPFLWENWITDALDGHGLSRNRLL